MPDSELDDVRRAALKRIESAERNFKIGLLAAAAFEALFLVAFFLLADLKSRLHLLILVSSVSVYTIVGLGMIALGAHVSRSTQLVLKALSLLGDGRRV